ncbi:hypothetical protein GQ43DRAFT_371359 [Delitschia confertaspora ATCC 74209]|uniref:GDSL-like protein n=1 Tax=Delitschia confertaspora ATCC 74209 TaxID=1513339 RepID=A0A9P4JL89_9PLEO|nr:hypothetical protein GQ43DRAFT_371359 [Delitschia confertaspora ATCC 74209]
MPSLKASILALGLVSASVEARDKSSNGWNLKNFKSIVTFGDSYTDENRLGYFGGHNGQAPPVGWEQPMGLKTATGGLSWPRYASIYTSKPLHNYAVSGAVCSNQVTPRTWSSINAPFPDIAGYELPAYIADSKFRYPNGTKFIKNSPSESVYAIWIGTNDVGNDAFLTDSQVKGKTLKDFADCVYSTIDGLYKNGGRYFVLLNLAPLQLLPQYAVPEKGGLEATKYFPDKAGKNATEISWRMYETVVTVNEVFKYRTPVEVEVDERWRGAKVANLDVNGLMTDIYNHPASYLNGTAPLNVTGNSYVCDAAGNNCTDDPNRDAYLWYDELHPSEQAERVVAKEFVNLLKGESKWATYWS